MHRQNEPPDTPRPTSEEVKEYLRATRPKPEDCLEESPLANAIVTNKKLDRIIELLGAVSSDLNYLARREHDKEMKIGFFPTVHVIPDHSIHYPLSGDPEPTGQPEFNPMTLDDREAVERWTADLNSHTEISKRRMIYVHTDSTDSNCTGDWCMPETHPDHWKKEEESKDA